MQKNLPSLALAICLAVVTCGPVAAQAVTKAEAQAALNAYNRQNYADATVLFENIIRRQPTATYCYYAALSNLSCHKELRGKQLFQYIISSFPNSQEAALAKKALGSSPQPAEPAKPNASTAAAGAKDNADDLPESVKALLPEDMKKMLDTPAGRAAVKGFVKDHSDQVSTIKKAETAGVLQKDKLAAAAEAQGIVVSHPELGASDHPFSAQDIAKRGAKAIDQFRYPNCWFEASMSALAELPRGQRLLASMIRSRGHDTYVVKFPGDGVEYTVTAKDMQKNHIHDSALWASLIECAQIQKFPDNKGAEGSFGDQSRLEVGLGCITGCKAEFLTPSNCSEQELSAFIGGAVKSKNPIVCATYPTGVPPLLIVPRHAYTITGFDPTKNMITLRNPWGKQPFPVQLHSEQHDNQFEQLDDGVIKLSVPLFQKYFYQVARSFI